MTDERSQSLNIISTSDGTEPETLKPVKRPDKQVRHRPRNPPRNSGRGTLQTKKFHIRLGEQSFFESKGIKKQEAGSAAQRCEPQSAPSRFFVDAEAFKGRNKPHSEPVVSKQDVRVHQGGSQIFILQNESQDECVDLDVPASTASPEKVYKSRLTLPRPAKNIIQDKKAVVSRMMAAGKQGCLTQQALEVAETPSSEIDVVQKCSFAVDPGSWSEGEVMPDISTWCANQNKIQETSNSVENSDLVVKISSLPEGRSFGTELEPFEPPEEVVIGEVFEEEVDGEAGKIQEKSRDSLSDCFEWRNLPVQMLEDWRGLEKGLHTVLRAFLEILGFAAEMSRTYPGIQGSLSEQISNLEEMLKNLARTMSDEHEPTGEVTGDVAPLKDLPEESETPEHPESMEQHASLMRDCLDSGTLGAASLQTNHVSLDLRETCEDALGPNTENTSSKVIVSESCRGKRPEGVFDIEVMSCSEEFVLLKPDFAGSRAMESGSDWGSVESSKNQVLEVTKRELTEKSQSCEKKSEETLSTKIRWLIERTAEEIKAMAAPELVLMRQKQVDTSEGLEEPSVRDIDSCEEVDEVAAQQPATQPVTEVMVGDVKVFSAMSSVKQLRRKEEDKTVCKIS